MRRGCISSRGHFKTSSSTYRRPDLLKSASASSTSGVNRLQSSVLTQTISTDDARENRDPFEQHEWLSI